MGIRRRALGVACCFAALVGSAARAGPPDAVTGQERRDDDRRPQQAQGGWVERTPEFLESVSRAIDLGVEWLRSQQRADGGYEPYNGFPAASTAIAYHTLRTCGVPATDPACVRAYEALRREYAAAKADKALRTYTAGVVMLAVADHVLADAPDRAARRPPPPRKFADERDRSWMNELVAFLENCQSTTGAWRYGETQPYGARVVGDDHDHSNTQYAAQGLRAAASIGCEVRRETWVRLLDHLVAAQQEDGPPVRFAPARGPKETVAVLSARARGWSYYRLDDPRFARESPQPYGSMTAGCVAAAAAARSELLTRRVMPQNLDRRSDAAVRDGLAWLGKHFSVADNPGRPGWRLYYLYAMERAGDLAGVDWMGERDWYGEGALRLVSEQQRDGTWTDGPGSVVGTCFALLFLRRGTAPADAGGVTPGGAEEPLPFARAASFDDEELGDLVDLVLLRWRRTPNEQARSGLAAGAASVGARMALALLVKMDARDPEKRRAAHEVLTRIGGPALAFDPDAAPSRRAEQLVQFEGWYLSVAPRLRYDPVSERLVVGAPR